MAFYLLTEIHPDYFKIPASDQKEAQKIYEKLSKKDAEDDNIEKDQNKRIKNQ